MTLTRLETNNLMLYQFLAGAFSGFMEQIITQPLDVIKTRLQLGSQQISINKAFKALYNEGICDLLEKCFVFLLHFSNVCYLVFIMIINRRN